MQLGALLMTLPTAAVTCLISCVWTLLILDSRVDYTVGRPSPLNYINQLVYSFEKREEYLFRQKAKVEFQ